MKILNSERFKEKYNIETGFLNNGLPYARIGNKPHILINIKGLSFKNEPPSGFMLKEFYKSSKDFTSDYTFYQIGRKPNLLENYLMDKMANDYAQAIREEFKGPVNVMGVSTGGQIGLQLAVDHPDVIRKLVIISAAYRLSDNGVRIERKAAEFFKQGEYGKTMNAIMEFMFKSRFRKSIIKPFASLVGKRIMKDIKYPNDFLTEVLADREFNLIDRLSEIQVPTLILSGEYDIGYIAEDVKKTAEQIATAELILYKGYGHNLYRSNRKQLYGDILNFLKYN